MVLGLVPDCPVESVRSVGNASGAGAARMLLSSTERAEVESTVKQIIKIETGHRAPFPRALRGGNGVPPQDCTQPPPSLGCATTRTHDNGEDPTGPPTSGIRQENR